MTLSRARAYNNYVFARRPALTVLFALACAALCGPARADDIAAGPGPIVNVQLDNGHIAFVTWNRPFVRITTAGNVNWSRVPATPSSTLQVNMWADSTQTFFGTVTLPAEPFFLPPIPGVRDAIVARGYGDTTVFVPENAALLIGHVSGKGGISVTGYQGAAIAVAHDGAVVMQAFTGTAFLQALRGRISATDSTFDRVRARSGVGPIVFSRCAAGQIDASSVTGAVLYDDGTLGQGPVHFSSVYSNVGVGIASYPGTLPSEVVNGTATATLGARGPVVTASSTRGNAFIYNGSMQAHPDLLARWPRAGVLLETPAAVRRPPLFRRPPSARRGRPPF